MAAAHGSANVEPSVSIVIPNLNSPIVDRTIEAIRQQSRGLADVEVLIVGLDSPGLIDAEPPIAFISTGQPAPPAVARNIGIEKARGETVVFTDADCIPHRDWLQALLSALRRSGATGVGGAVSFGTTGYWTLADNVSSFHEFLTSSPAGRRDHLPSLNLAVLRKALTDVGGFDERYPRPAGEDSDLSYRLRAAGHELLFDPSAVVQHCPSRSSPGALLRHAADFGRFSVKLRQHPKSASYRIFRHRGLLLALSPALAAAATARVFIGADHAARYLHTLPAVYAAKLAWCWGAANSPEWVREEQPAAP